MSLQMRELRHKEVKGFTWDPSAGCGELRSKTHPTLLSWKVSIPKPRPVVWHGTLLPWFLLPLVPSRTWVRLQRRK